MKYHSIVFGVPTFLLIVLLLACSKRNVPPEEKGEPDDPITTFFRGEVMPSASLPCFQGAYYRKVVSSKDVWTGISGKVVLPQMAFDEGRRNPAKPEQYLDNPSIYMGGNMNGQETDIGLLWEVIREENGSISPDRKAFRPFLRRTGYAPAGQTAVYENAPAQKEFYWYPGNEVEMTIQMVENGKLRFIVEGAGKRFERDFECAGYNLNSIGEFKRVNAIDQVANEGKPAQPTNTRVEGAAWKETWLFRRHDGGIVKVPVHDGRFTDMRCPDRKHFRVTANEAEKKAGAEQIDIGGGGY